MIVQSRRHRQSWDGTPRVILPFSKASVTQNTAGRYIHNPFTGQLYGPFGAGELAVFDYLGDQFGQIHEAWDETCGKSETFDDWTKIASPVVTPNQITAPDPAKLADKIAFPSAHTARIERILGSATDNTDQSTGVWMRTLTGTHNIRYGFMKKSGAASYNEVTVTPAWQRFFHTTDIAAGATDPLIIIRNQSGGGAGTIYVWGCNVYKDKSVPGPYMENDTGSDQAYAKDQVSFAAGIVPVAAMRNSYAFRFIPFWAHNEPGNVRFLRFHKDGTHYVDQYYDAGVDKLKTYYRDGGGLIVALVTGAITINRNTLATVENYPGLGRQILSGFASGNGVYTDTAWDTIITSDKVLHCGQDGAAANQINGLITPPYRPNL